MNKMFFPFTLAVFSVVASSAAFAATPYKNDYCTTLGLNGDTRKVKGDRYVLAGSTKTYKNESSVFFIGQTALFDTLDGYAGSDDYSYQDFKEVAKRRITFPSRGSNFVSITVPLLDGNNGSTTLCKNINVQSPPTISKKVLNTNGGIYAEVNSTYDDAFSKAAVEGVGVTYTWNSRNVTYPGSGGDSQKVTSTPYTTFGSDYGGSHAVSVTINDGVYSKRINLGSVRVRGSGPCRPVCTLPAD